MQTNEILDHISKLRTIRECTKRQEQILMDALVCAKAEAEEIRRAFFELKGIRLHYGSQGGAGTAQALPLPRYER